jgi:hypothetical protein
MNFLTKKLSQTAPVSTINADDRELKLNCFSLSSHFLQQLNSTARPKKHQIMVYERKHLTKKGIKRRRMKGGPSCSLDFRLPSREWEI